MLLPHQVVPFLQHDDPDVRDHAVHYLADAHDPAPASADDLWRSIDRFGPEASVPLLARLGDLPHTTASLDWVLQALRSKPDEKTDYHLQRALEWVDLPLLLARRDEVLDAPEILPHVRDHLRARLDLAHVPIEELWERLLRASHEADGKHVGQFDSLAVDRLVEALARHEETAASKAMDRLRNGPRDDWMKIFSVQLLGELRHAPATQMLVDRLLVEADLLNEEAVHALARIGTTEVVERLEAVYPGQEWGIRIFLDDPLGRIKRPESEQALLRLLEAEPKDDLKTHLAAELCELCTTDGLGQVRRLIVDDRYDPQVANLPESLLTVGKMVGYEPPEAAEWRAGIERRRKELKRRDGGMLEQILRDARDRFRRGEPPWTDPDDFDGEDDEFGDDALDVMEWSPDDYLDRPPAAPATIRRDAPKIGRNDPCPCGSGKKYKKCCLKSAEA